MFDAKPHINFHLSAPLAVPSASKYKTVSALTKRVLNFEGKHNHREVSAQKALERDIRKRSLNFHQYHIVPQIQTEVAIGVLRSIASARGARRITLTRLLDLLGGNALPNDYTAHGSLRTLAHQMSTHFDGLPPPLYPRVLELLSSHVDKSGRAQAVVKRIASRIAGCDRQIVVAFSHDSAPWATVGSCVVQCERFLSRQNVKAIRTRVNIELLRFHLADPKCTNSGLTGNILKYLSCFSPVTAVEFPLLRAANSRLTAMLHQANKPVVRTLAFTLFHPEGRSKPESAMLLPLLNQYTAILAKLPKQPYQLGFTEYRRALNRFIELNPGKASRLDLIRFVVTDAKLGFCPLSSGYGVFSTFLRKTPTLSSLPESDLRLLLECADTVGFHDRFQRRRLENACIKQTIEIPVRTVAFPDSLRGVIRAGRTLAQLSHDDRLRLLTSIEPRWAHRRPVRRLIHAVSGSINPGRLSPSVLPAAPLPFNAGAELNSKLRLATVFHHPEQFR